MPKHSAVGPTLPLLPLADSVVLLPGGFVRTRASAALVADILRQHGSGAVTADVAAVPIVGAASHSAESTDWQDDVALDFDRVHNVGCAARVVQLQRAPESDWILTLEGRCRVAVEEVAPPQGPGRHLATVKQLDYLTEKGGWRSGGSAASGKEQEQLLRSVLRGVRRLLAAADVQQGDLGARTLRLLQSAGPALTSDVVGSLVARTFGERLALLSAVDTTQRLKLVAALLERVLSGAGDRGAASISSKAISSIGAAAGSSDGSGGSGARRTTAPVVRPRRPSDPAAPSADSGDEDDAGDEAEAGGELRSVMTRLSAAAPPAEVRQVAQREARRLRHSSEQHPGYAAALSYLESLAALPWSRRSAPPGQPLLTLPAVRAQLDADHCGLDKVKERIVQYCAVQRLRGPDAPAPILCFIGPPGVGKTSLARSVAAALRRPFHRISLGGVRDEAEIRGHRRTYVGALPGRVVQALRRAGVADPVLLLDEVDKMGRDARGDPAAALLEVLDPEQNAAFVDTYLGVAVDLSGVVFVATANVAADIPPPLLDRLEVVNLGGYTAEERLRIAARHLVPRALIEHGIPPSQLHFPPEALRLIIEGYTREAGVRSLGRCLAAICRHVAVQLVTWREEEAAGAGVAGMAGQRFEDDGQQREQEREQPPPQASEGGQLVAGGGGSLAAAAGRASWPAGRQALLLPGVGPDPHQERQPLQQQAAGSSPARASPPGNSGGPPAASDAGQHAEGGHGMRLLGPGSMGVLTPSFRPAAASAPIAPSPLPTASAPASPLPAAAALAQPPPAERPSPPPPAAQFVVDAALIEAVLGPRRHHGHDASQRVATPGTAAGLVWTAAGGQVLYIEALCVGGGRKDSPGTLTLTGQLGDVLEESARIAVSWVRAHAAALGLEPGPSCPARRWDVHVHLPAGATPKDGPSAGVTLAVALVSLFLGRCVRGDTAMTGELTLRGHVLPVGGCREKCVAAYSAGMRRVIVPARCVAEVEAGLSAEVRAALEVVGVERVEQVLAAAFTPPLEMTGQVTELAPRL